MPDQPKEPTAQELIDSFNEKLRTSDFDGTHDVVGNLKAAVNKFVEEKVYRAGTHAELGRHVEAIMKHFKGL